MKSKNNEVKFVPVLTHSNALHKIAKLCNDSKSLDITDVLGMEKMNKAIENAEIEAVTDYVTQITRFIGNKHNAYQLVFEATAFSLVASALLNTCKENGIKHEEKCKEMWDMCSERLVVKIQQGDEPNEC